MKLDTNLVLQWIGAPLIILGHSFNALGPEYYPWNVITFFFGTSMFLTWSYRVANKPQMLVNTVSLTLGGLGLINAFFG